MNPYKQLAEELTEAEKSIVAGIGYLRSTGSPNAGLKTIQTVTELNFLIIEEYMEHLVETGLLKRAGSDINDTYFELTSEGQNFILENNLLLDND